MSSSVVVTVLWQIAIIDRIAHDSYRINITSIDAEHDRSMREVYGLDKCTTRVNSHNYIGDFHFRTSDSQISGSCDFHRTRIFTL